MKNLFTVIFLSCSLAVAAQLSFEISPIGGDVSVDIDELGAFPDLMVPGTVTNTGDTPIRLRWERELISVSPEWESAVCDPIRCWAPARDTSSFDLAVGESGNWIMHAYPDLDNGDPVLGSLIMKVSIYAVAQPDLRVEGTYTYEVNELVDAQDLDAQRDITIYPIPAYDRLTIESDYHAIREVRILSVLGIEKLRVALDASGALDVSGLLPGNYLLRLIDPEGRSLRTMRFQKN